MTVVPSDFNRNKDNRIRRKGLRRAGNSYPAGPVAGDLFYKLDTDNLWVYDGANWQIIETGGVSPPLEHYLFTQLTPSATWVINHNLGWEPNIATIDSAGDEVFGSVHHNSTSQTTVTFSSATAGRATAS